MSQWTTKLMSMNWQYTTLADWFFSSTQLEIADDRDRLLGPFFARPYTRFKSNTSVQMKRPPVYRNRARSLDYWQSLRKNLFFFCFVFFTLQFYTAPFFRVWLGVDGGRRKRHAHMAASTINNTNKCNRIPMPISADKKKNNNNNMTLFFLVVVGIQVQLIHGDGLMCRDSWNSNQFPLRLPKKKKRKEKENYLRFKLKGGEGYVSINRGGRRFARTLEGNRFPISKSSKNSAMTNVKDKAYILKQF